MKFSTFLLLGFVLAAPAWAAPVAHPANADAPMPVFHPVDFLAQAEPAHRHEAPAPQQSDAEEHAGHDHDATGPEQHDEAGGKKCKRAEHCCCRCCKDKMKSDKSDMEGCGMTMDKDAAPEDASTRKEEGHAAHH